MTPTTSDRPHLMRSATALARGIREGAWTSREVVDAHIRHIRAVNPTINAIVAERFALAQQEADAADAAIQRGGAVGPLHGVPITIKESFAVVGMPQTAGLVARRGLLAAEDAPTVARLKAAGAVVVGVTNTSELCMWMETTNRVYGRTRNPYDPARIVGGSSGGEGAIVGAGGAPVGLGADIGGSIRMPAFFNGVFGHKPTSGLVPGTGQFPFPENDATGFLTTGPLARRAEDLMPFLRIIAGPDGEDPAARSIPLGDPAALDLSNLHAVSIEGNGLRAVHPALTAAQRECAAVLEGLGVRVRTLRLKALKRSLEVWSRLMNAAAATPFRTLLGNGRPLPWRAFPRFFIGRSEHTLAALVLAAGEHLPMFHVADAAPTRRLADDLRGQINELLGEQGVLIYPSYTRPAPRHTAPLFTPFDFAYTALFNILGNPVTQVPLGLWRRRAPLGVQIVGPRAHDHVAIAVAIALERAFGGWTPPWHVR